MSISDNVLNILTAKKYKGIGKAWFYKHLSGGESAERMVELIQQNDPAITIDKFNRDKASLKRYLAHLPGATAFGDPDFPKHRGNVRNSEKPIALFYQGDLSLLALEQKNIAVIGLKNPDLETEQIERELVRELVKNGVCIVSGLALGCDTIAHRQALESNGKTVAILPSSLDNILPEENRNLAQEIVKNGGLLISEYYEDPKSYQELRGRYQERDRLQALFSDAIVLSASYAKNNLGYDSGSRLAMGYARAYSIPRAVLYEKYLNADNPKYDLNRQLIDEEGVLVINKGNLTQLVGQLLSQKQAPQIAEGQQLSLFQGALS